MRAFLRVIFKALLFFQYWKKELLCALLSHFSIGFCLFSPILYYYCCALTKTPNLSHLDSCSHSPCLQFHIPFNSFDNGVTIRKCPSNFVTPWLNNLQTLWYFQSKVLTLAGWNLTTPSPHLHTHLPSLQSNHIHFQNVPRVLWLHTFALAIRSSWDAFPFFVHFVNPRSIA